MSVLQGLIAELLSGDDERADRAVTQIAELGESALPDLIGLTFSPHADSRWWAVRALAASPHSRTENLLPLLGDSAPEVRAATALALLEHPHDSAIPALIAALSDKDSITASLAGNALAKIGSSSTPGLLEVMDEAQTSIRILALRALCEIRDHRAIPAMMKCLGEDSAVLQYWAQEGLEKLGLNMVYIKP